MAGDGISETGQASRTAMMAATARGWHRYQHGSRSIHDDWLGWPLVGPDVEQLLAANHAIFGDAGFLMANWIAARSRIAEDWLIASGAQQYVVLGAGLDSFAWRAPEGMRVFEVDHPASQRWKQDRLKSMMIDAPDGLTWVGVDFEQDSISRKLQAAGLDVGQAVFVSWLGVTPYLSTAAISATLADLPSCDLALTYAPPDTEWSVEAREVTESFLPVAAALGEPIVSLLNKEEVERLLLDARFRPVEEIRASAIEPRFGVPAVANLEERVVLARRDP